jgi:hypothetical protein
MSIMINIDKKALYIILILLTSLHILHILQGDEEEEAMDLSGVDVWAADFDPTTVFDAESLREITNFFVKNAGDMDGQIRCIMV